ncbi:MAG: cation diffusion facilitator family transporter [Planctomycetota bacterium]
MTRNTQRIQKLLPIITLIGSLILGVALIFAWHYFHSNLALALAADSIVDVFTAAVLAWSVHVASQPQDEDHPFGHSRAEPIAALIVAVIACVVGFEVGKTAIETLASESRMIPDNRLALLFAAKLAFKLIICALIIRQKSNNPSLRALFVDSRNDVVLSALALGGYGLAASNYPDLDIWLALPVSAGIAWSGISLARENIKLLMGEAPSEERQQALVSLVETIDGVNAGHDFRAQYLGTELQVHIHIVVNETLTVKEAHDIGEKVQRILEDEDDVGHAFVHIDIEHD